MKSNLLAPSIALIVSLSQLTDHQIFSPTSIFDISVLRA